LRYAARSRPSSTTGAADYYRQRSQRYGIGTVLDDAAVRVIISVRPTAFITYGPARKPTPTV
jgi:hypothetical protein